MTVRCRADVCTVLLSLLMAACDAPDPEPRVVHRETVEWREVTPEEEEEAITSGRIRPVGTFPGGAYGCYRCDVTSCYYRAGAEEPTEDERTGAALHIGANAHSPSSMVATVEGCPFFVTREALPNPEAFVLGPNTCGETRYHDGIMLVRGEVIRGEQIFRTLRSGLAVDAAPGEGDSWERTEWWVTVQLTGRFFLGRRRNEHAIHTYMCMRERCMR